MRKIRKHITTIILAVLAVIAGVYAYNYHDMKQNIVYNEHLEDVAVNVNGKELTLRDMAFYVAYEEFVFCGYGEPTCALDILEKTAKYVKEKYKLPIRVNTNGLGNLYHGRDIVPELSEYIDSVSISLNAANAEEYNKVTRPTFDNAYEAMLDFAEECNRMIKHTQLSIVDVLPEEDIKTCQQIADERGIHLKIRHFSN